MKGKVHPESPLWHHQIHGHFKNYIYAYLKIRVSILKNDSAEVIPRKHDKDIIKEFLKKCTYMKTLGCYRQHRNISISDLTFIYTSDLHLL